MCWETNSQAIVMLTRCVEKDGEKCDRYWPYDTEPVFYGDIQVTILNESHFPDWIVSTFRYSHFIFEVMYHCYLTFWQN